MAQLLQYGAEMLRINPSNNSIEYSRDGRNWTRKFSSQYYGTFYDLCLVGSDVYAATQKGVIFSHDGGRNWTGKYTGTTYGTFQSLMLRGTELWAQTTKGTYVSKDGGRNWMKR